MNLYKNKKSNNLKMASNNKLVLKYTGATAFGRTNTLCKKPTTLRRVVGFFAIYYKVFRNSNFLGYHLVDISKEIFSIYCPIHIVRTN